MKVAVYGVAHQKGRQDKPNLVGHALRNGFKKHGIECLTRERFDGEVIADVALAYGWLGELTTHVFTKYKEAGKHFVFFDLGYWGRSQEGHYRLGINDWDTALNMRRGCSSDRFEALRIPLRSDWAPKSKRIMIVGMSGKAAWTHGYKEGEWEENTREDLVAAYPEFTVYIRQKPNKHSRRMPPIEEDLKDCYFVVSHHSNVAVDALVAGVPFCAKKGVGALLSPQPFDPVASIENVYFPPLEDKLQLLYDTAYAQWTPQEMRDGHCWDYIKGVLAI